MNVIDIKKLSKSFNNCKVVDNFHIQVKKGQIYGFLGPNGSGKTTTIRMICGLLTPDEVNGSCLGYNIANESALIKKQVGYMTQHFSFYKDLSIYENLMFVARLYGVKNKKEQIKKLLDKFSFSRNRIKQLSGQLSGGWKQRLALAAAVIHEPKLLLLDEPTAGVDPKARRDFWSIINELSAEGVTTLVSTHYMDEVERCHELVYMAYGKLLCSGTKQDILNYANLDNFEVFGENIYQTAQKIIKENSDINVGILGNSMHITAAKSLNLVKFLTPYMKQAKLNKQHWQKNTPSLESVFIYLMKDIKDNMS